MHITKHLLFILTNVGQIGPINTSPDKNGNQANFDIEMRGKKPHITLKEALEKMENGLPFSLIFYTADKKRNTGGKRKELKDAVLVASDYGNSIRTLKIGPEKLIDVHIRLMVSFNSRRIII